MSSGDEQQVHDDDVAELLTACDTWEREITQNLVLLSQMRDHARELGVLVVTTSERLRRLLNAIIDRKIVEEVPRFVRRG